MSDKENMVWIRSLYLDMDSGSGLLPKFNQFFLMHRYICREFFCEDRFSSFHVKLLTDKQTDTGHHITSLADVMTTLSDIPVCSMDELSGME